MTQSNLMACCGLLFVVRRCLCLVFPLPSWLRRCLSLRFSGDTGAAPAGLPHVPRPGGEQLRRIPNTPTSLPHLSFVLMVALV